MAVDFGVAQTPTPVAPVTPIVPPTLPQGTPPAGPVPFPDLTHLLPNLANLSNLIPANLLPPGVLPSDVNPIVTKLFEMFFKFVGGECGRSRQQPSRADAREAASGSTSTGTHSIMCVCVRCY